MSRQSAQSARVELQRESLSKSERDELRRLLAIEPGPQAVETVTRTGLAPHGLIDAADKQLIERAAAAALARAHGLAPEAAVQHVLGPIVLSAVSLVGVAGLMLFWLRAPASVAPTAAPTPQAEQQPAPAPQLVEAPRSVLDSAAVSGNETAPAPVPAPVIDGLATSAELFRRANAARRAGDDARAGRGYRRLIAEHPLSPEASPAAVSLAKLLLAGGAAAEADRVLARYFVRDRGSRQLDEEALVIHGKVLSALGQRGRERSKWRALVEHHPNSVYVELAKERLAQLQSGSGRVDP